MIRTHNKLIAHPHTKLPLPTVESLSTSPILFTQVPVLDTVSNKLISFIDASPNPASLQTAKQTLSGAVLPYLNSRFPDKSASAVAAKRPAIPVAPQLLTAWSAATATLVPALPPAQLFPLVDMWRLAVLDVTVANWLSSSTANHDPIHILLQKALSVLDSDDATEKSGARNYLLTVLRTLANGFAHAALSKILLSGVSPGGKRAQVTRVVVATLLHEDAAVRTAAASLAFDVAAALQKSRVERVRGATVAVEVEEDEEWEVELVSAVLEALGNEVQSEEVGE